MYMYNRRRDKTNKEIKDERINICINVPLYNVHKVTLTTSDVHAHLYVHVILTLN